MEINFFGLMDVTRKAMETMRELKTGGVIQNVTSIGGQIGRLSCNPKCSLLKYFRRANLQHLLREQVGCRRLY